MTRVLVFTLIYLFIGTISAQAQNTNLKSIFNGEDLSGWVEPENNIWWTAKDGILTANYGPDRKGSILWTKKQYKDFVVQLDFKFISGNIDTGIFLRSESPQIQIGISGSLKRDMTGSPYLPGKGYPVEAKGAAKLLKPMDWNTIKVAAKGNSYTVWLNGEEILQYEGEDGPTKGPIGLQLHGKRNMVVDFRNILVGKM